MGIIEQLNERIEGKIPAVIPKCIQPTYTWETAVGYIQHCADNSEGEPISILYYKLPVADQIDSITPVKEYLSEHIKGEIDGVDMYVTLCTVNKIKYHSDNDVLIWNVLGHSELHLDGEDRSIEPGDLIYVPKDIEYTFNPNTARSYIVFALKS